MVWGIHGISDLEKCYCYPIFAAVFRYRLRWGIHERDSSGPLCVSATDSWAVAGLRLVPCLMVETLLATGNGDLLNSRPPPDSWKRRPGQGESLCFSDVVSIQIPQLWLKAAGSWLRKNMVEKGVQGGNINAMEVWQSILEEFFDKVFCQVQKSELNVTNLCLLKKEYVSRVG